MHTARDFFSVHPFRLKKSASLRRSERKASEDAFLFKQPALADHVIDRTPAPLRTFDRARSVRQKRRDTPRRRTDRAVMRLVFAGIPNPKCLFVRYKNSFYSMLSVLCVHDERDEKNVFSALVADRMSRAGGSDCHVARDNRFFLVAVGIDRRAL